MKFILTMIMCTSVYNMCLDPFPMPTKYSSHYECMIAGYEESIKKAKEDYDIKDDVKNIVCGISASGPTKRWDIDNYIKLIWFLD